MKEQCRVAPGDLRRTCDPTKFPFENTDTLEILEGIIGQPRAVEATEFGLSVSAPGYNIYLAGPAGTGKSTYAATTARQKASSMECQEDWCYIYSFDKPDRPRAVRLPRGWGARFKKDMDELVEEMRQEIRKAFQGTSFEDQQRQVLRKFQDMMQEVQKEVESRARETGFSLQRTSTGLVSVPMVDDKPLTPEEFNELDPDTKQELGNKHRTLEPKIQEAVKQIRALEKEAREKVQSLERDMGLSAISPLIDRLKERYKNSQTVVEHLDRTRQDVIEHLNMFKEEGSEQAAAVRGDRYLRYRVNVLVTSDEDGGAPVEIESNPTYHNLVGKTEYRGQVGSAMTTDFTMIKPGALHRANGGFLLLNIKDVLSNPMAWEGLKRSLKNRSITIEDMGEQYRAVPTATLKPEPIPLKVKVLLLGNQLTYHLLHAHDEDFRKLFKIRADFNVQMDRTPDHLNLYASLIGSLCRRENLCHFSREAVARVVDEGSRLAGDKQKLSTRFNELVEIVYEADAWAAREGADSVSSRHVQKAVEARVYRSNLLEESVQEMILRGKIMVDTQGRVVGQVNGIAVHSVGDYAFGRPSRITARTYMGRAGVVNIERETKMSGRSHSKGVMILTAYLGSLFATRHPLSLSASLTFEQTYEEIDGDSASSVELYALLSSLSGVALSQELAVTGSVNQRGEIQPIGGVNEKIEGFFSVCQQRGLTGTQGVIIPRQNVDNLMLRDNVVEAVRDGSFHVYAIGHVDEGIELLTGMKAGTPDESGEFPPGTIYSAVAARLHEMAVTMARLGRQEERD